MTFNEWFDEVEAFGLRSERFYADLYRLQQFNTGDYIPGGPSYQDIVRWLKAAYEAGREHEYEKNLEDNGGTL